MANELLRSDISKGLSEGKAGVDRENGIIRGFAVISVGEAKGHGMEIDAVALEQVVEFGNASTIGIKSRFGHPSMSSEALGTFLGRAKNFRRDGNIDRADLHIDKSAYNTPNGNLAEYVMNLAESDPNSFGTSIVFEGKREERLENDGTRKKNEKGEDLLPLVRFTKLLGVDAVDNPAANNGMFAEQFFSESVMPSAEMSKFLDKFLQNPGAVDKTLKFLQRYSALNQDGGENVNKEGKLEDTPPTVPPAPPEPEVPAEPESPKKEFDYKCEACGYEMKSEEDSVDLKCPECGGVMKKQDKENVTGEQSEQKGGNEMERIDKIEKGQEKLQRQATEGAVERFMESHSSQILPAFSGLLKTVLIETSLAESEKTISFTEEGKPEVKLSVGEAVQEIVCRLPKLVEFTEKAPIDPNSPAEKEKAEYQEIVKYSNEHKVSISEARRLMAENKGQ